jgi:hypothetical protein
VSGAAVGAFLIVSADAGLTSMPPWRGRPIVEPSPFASLADASRRVLASDFTAHHGLVLLDDPAQFPQRRMLDPHGPGARAVKWQRREYSNRCGRRRIGGYGSGR